MDLAAEQIFLFSQGDRSLEEHTEDFSDLHHHVHYDEDRLCVFFQAGLNVEAPQESTCLETIFEGCLWNL